MQDHLHSLHMHTIAIATTQLWLLPFGDTCLIYFICTVFHRIFYRPSREVITDKSVHVALLFLPLLIWQACSSMYNSLFHQQVAASDEENLIISWCFFYKACVNWKLLFIKDRVDIGILKSILYICSSNFIRWVFYLTFPCFVY